MNMQTKFINDMLDTKIKHYQGRMDSAKKDVECYTTLSVIQNSANVISECATALELLDFVKQIVEQSESFCEIELELDAKDVATTVANSCKNTLDSMDL